MTLPDNGNKSLKDKRKTKNWKDSFGQNAESTDWGKVGNALFVSIITTLVWVIVGADIIYYATRPLAGSKENLRGHLDYIFPSDITQAPYFICDKPGNTIWEPHGPKKCPYNGWKPNPGRDGKRGPSWSYQIGSFFTTVVLTLNDAMTGLGAGKGGKNMKGGDKKTIKGGAMKGGGSGDFYSCSRGSLTLDAELPDKQSKPSFPYSFAGGEANALCLEWGTANPMTALGYLTAKMFTMGRGGATWFFEMLRPLVAGGGSGQTIVMLLSGFIIMYGMYGGLLLCMGAALICAVQAIVGLTTNYVGPYEEIDDMALGSRIKYWIAWFASYLVPVLLAIYGGWILSAYMVASLVFIILLGPFLTTHGRGTIKSILSCNAPWVMVIFGGLFLSSTVAYMNPGTWMGMGVVYGICSLITIWHWFKNKD